MLTFSLTLLERSIVTNNKTTYARPTEFAVGQARGQPVVIDRALIPALDRFLVRNTFAGDSAKSSVVESESPWTQNDRRALVGDRLRARKNLKTRNPEP